MSEYNLPSVLVKFNDLFFVCFFLKKGEKWKKRASDNNISCAVFCQTEKKDHGKKEYSQSNLQQTETVEEVIVLINMQGQPFKCVVEAPIRFLRVL